MAKGKRVSARKRAANPLVRPSKSRDTLVAETFERLGVTPESVAPLPKITHVLKELPDGIPQAIEFLRGSSETDARKWLDIYDEIPPSYRDLVPLEAYCLAANITTKRLLELVTGACFEQSDAASNLIAKASKPKVIQATVKAALTLKGTQDRKMMHLHEGFVPVPRTSVVNVHGGVNMDNRVQSINIGELGGIESDMKRIGDRFNDRMQLESNEPKLIEGEVSASVDERAEPGPANLRPSATDPPPDPPTDDGDEGAD